MACLLGLAGACLAGLLALIGYLEYRRTRG